jgi:hypothetical protein
MGGRRRWEAHGARRKTSLGERWLWEDSPGRQKVDEDDGEVGDKDNASAMCYQKSTTTMAAGGKRRRRRREDDGDGGDSKRGEAQGPYCCELCYMILSFCAPE